MLYLIQKLRKGFYKMSKIYTVNQSLRYAIYEQFIQGIAPYSNDRVQYLVYSETANGCRLVKSCKTEKAAINYVKKMGAK